MSENRNNASFQYTYSAGEQEEIRKIRSKYLPKEENKMEHLRRLDAQVTQKATVYSLATGILGALILGMGMSCCLVWADIAFVPGIAIGVIGMGVLALAYPLYNRTIQRERERIAPEVLRLTEDLMK